MFIAPHSTLSLNSGGLDLKIAKKVFYRMDSDVARAGLFFALAYFAGSKRFIETFPTANRQGLMVAAATSSLGLRGSEFLTNRIGLKNRTLLCLVYKSLVVATTALFTTSWIAKAFGRKVEILSRDVIKFAYGTTGVIVGTHLTRYSQPMPSREVDLDKLENDIDILGSIPLSKWKMSDSVYLFNPDTVLDGLGDENVIAARRPLGTQVLPPQETWGTSRLYQRARVLYGEARVSLYKDLFYLGRELMVSPDVMNKAITRINGYSGQDGPDPRKNEVQWYLNKILLYLLSKKEAYQQDRDQTPEGKETLKKLTEKIMVRIEDAHQGCIDQQTIQLESLMIEIVDDFGLSEIEKTVAVQLRKYRAALINQCIISTGEHHQADLGVDLTNSIARALGLPTTRSTRHNANYNTIYSQINFQKARNNFFAEYDPVGHLLKLTDLSQITQSGTAVYVNENETQQFSTSMFLWFRDNIAGGLIDKGLSEDEGNTRMEKLLGADFSTIFDRKDSAVVYYLFKNKLIML